MNWKRQDYQMAILGIGFLAVLVAASLLRLHDDPQVEHVGTNVFTGAVWIGLPAGLLTLAMRKDRDGWIMETGMRVWNGLLGLGGLVAGTFVLMGWA